MFKVLITGASQGIGAEIAHDFAKRGAALLLVARNQAKLESVATECRKLGAPEVQVLSADLSDPKSWEKVIAAGTTFQTNVLVNNAGYGLWGKFADLDLAELQKNIRLNIDALIALTHGLIPVLKQGPKGYIMNVASTTAFQALPSFAVYAASKSFVLMWSRALHHELKASRIVVSALVPGATTTGFIDRAGLQHLEETAKKMSMTAADVARIGVSGLLSGKIEVVPGAVNKLSAQLVPLFPKRWIEKAAAAIYLKKNE